MEIVYMKKIINYKMYNTETATMVASYMPLRFCGHSMRQSQQDMTAISFITANTKHLAVNPCGSDLISY